MYGKIRFVEAGQLRRKMFDSVVAPRFFGGSQNGMWTLQSPFIPQVGRPDPPKHLGAFFRLMVLTPYLSVVQIDRADRE